MKHVLTIVLLFIITTAAFAQQPQSIAEEIVVTASALPDEADETPVAATVITRAEIERRETRDVADVLREVPGLAVSRTGSPGKNVSLFVRGGSSKQALVLWNGVEMNNPYFSGYDFGQLSSAGVEKVEVVRGPFSALYGSEAVSGVINVLTTPRSSGASLDVEAGEQSLFNTALSGAKVSDRWNANGAVEWRTDGGFFDNDDFDASSLIGGVTAMPTDQFSAGVLARYSKYDLGVPFTPNASSDAFVASPNRREEGSQMQLAIPLQYTAGRYAFEMRLSESRRDDTFSDSEGPFGPERSEVDFTMRGARGTARTATSFGTITVGGEYERAVVDFRSNFGSIDSRDRVNRSVFVEDRVSLSVGARSSIEIAAGARHDDFDEFGSETSPRIAAAWVRNGHKLRASYGEGFRAPAIGELYFPFGGNVDLEAERSSNIEIGYERFSAAGSVSLTAFAGDYEGLIVFAPSFQFENIASATTRGLELGVEHRRGPVDVAFSYTWLDTEDEKTGEELLRRPQHSGSFALGYHAAAYSAQVVVTHKGERGDVTDLFPFGTVRNEAYTTADLVVHYALGAFRPYVKLENLTDRAYEEVFGYPSGRRRAIVGVRYAIR